MFATIITQLQAVVDSLETISKNEELKTYELSYAKTAFKILSGSLRVIKGMADSVTKAGEREAIVEERLSKNKE